MTLNERIRELRKQLCLSQKDFAEKIGISQRSVSWSEQPNNNVPDSTIKSICMAFSVNEEWLRYGTEPIYIQPPTFSLDDFARQHGATELELQIVKTYFELDADTRKMLISHFSRSFASAISENPALTVPDTTEELEADFPPVELSDTSGTDAG